MNRYLFTLAATLVLGTTIALADPGGEGNNTNCNGQGNPNSPCEPSGGTGGTGQGQQQSATAKQVQGQAQSNNNEITINVPSTRSGAPQATSQGGQGGSSSSESTSHSGAQASSGGNQTQQGVVVGGDTSTVVDNSTLVYEDSESVAATAASVYAQVCQSGGSAQGRAGGLSVVNSEPLCEHLKLASVFQNMYLWELDHGEVICQETMAGEGVPGIGALYTDTCYSRYAKQYYELMHEHLRDAELLMDKTEEAGLVDKLSGYLVRPLALIGALIWLI